MANRHFGKIDDVWKHLPLVEVLHVEQPITYGETHAGSAGYRLIDDTERRYEALRFLETAHASPLLAASPYRGHLARLMATDAGPGIYPGSPLLAMRERRRNARYVLCDLDANSIADIGGWADALGLGDRVETIVADGMTTIASRFLTNGAGGTSLVHVDPHAHAPGGPSDWSWHAIWQPRVSRSCTGTATTRPTHEHGRSNSCGRRPHHRGGAATCW